MTENKRFSKCKDMWKVFDWETSKTLNFKEIINLLNELHEENEGLKEYNNKLMKQPLLFDVQTIPKTMEILEANTKLEEENEQLKKENHGIQDKVIRLLDYVEVKQCVTRTEIKKWWNGDVE